MWLLQFLRGLMGPNIARFARAVVGWGGWDSFVGGLDWVIWVHGMVGCWDGVVGWADGVVWGGGGMVGRWDGIFG